MPQHTRQEKIEALGRVIDTLDELRVECPWDRVQTNESLRPNTIEEVYELCDALLAEDDVNIRKELGDVLLHVLFYAKIGEEKDAFDIADVCDALNDKLIFRHPHVFGERCKVNDAGEVMQNWEQLKLREKGGNRTVLAGVPVSLPSLVKAFRIQEKAAHVGFDWDEKEQVWDKVREETAEFEAEVAKGDHDAMEAELGDMFFSLVNLARVYGINPDTALERTNRKFISRFNHIEAAAKAQG
ncbi:MAG: nucleoside triphosphate pyrophosphohydrolase, partial [Muribaculaceae bacterium]|nr:nucleoside triphosphate pyrophosphohydrolase [Muribaculaceae bacterium]